MHYLFAHFLHRPMVLKLIINEIGVVSVKLAKPLFYDAYADNKANGSFILIDTQTNNTAGVGFIQ